MTTLAELAEEANLSSAEAWARLAGLTTSHLDALTPLTPADESMIRAALTPPGYESCGCAPAVGHTSPCLCAPR